jgi:hypothetical protein
MRRTLQRGPAGISLSYSDHSFSHNLTGMDFACEESGGTVRFSIDLTSNIRVRNKESANCYQDALDFAKRHSKLKSVQIDDPVAEKLAAVCKNLPDAVWKLDLNLGAKGTFNYSVDQVTRRTGSLFLDVRAEKGSSGPR